MNAASGSTATETTATADPGSGRYIGRFAPSPTGDLHLGSLVAALGSYLDARHHGGQWLLRMEDLDTPRVVPGCADRMLRTLECFGLTWDGAATYQSRHTEAYAEALARLSQNGFTFRCTCSRRLRSGTEDQGYPGTCRNRPHESAEPVSVRFRIDDLQTISFDDRFQGKCAFDLHALGDVVIRRRDGLFAYQLAVVVDDAASGITHVVRGADLLSSTAWQIALQAALGAAQPSYAHLPVVTEAGGTKLAKSRRSIPLDPAHAAPLLLTALRLLRQEAPVALESETPITIIKWGIDHWCPRAFHGIRAVHAPEI